MTFLLTLTTTPLIFEVGGIDAEVQNGNFEVLQEIHIPEVWELLKHQCVLSPGTLDFNLHISNYAWIAGGRNVNVDGIKLSADKKMHLRKEKVHSSSNSIIANGIIDDSLCDTALRTWILAYLLS